MTTRHSIRKSIDSLTAAELADYEHAFAKLKEISEADPSDIDGLQYFQDLHNTMLGPCEHANDTFMPWHRAHLFEFEEALRRSDPPRTANVALPYWDWSGAAERRPLPEGVREPGLRSASRVPQRPGYLPHRGRGAVRRAAVPAPVPRAERLHPDRVVGG